MHLMTNKDVTGLGAQVHPDRAVDGLKPQGNLLKNALEFGLLEVITRYSVSLFKYSSLQAPTISVFFSYKLPHD